MTDIFYWGKRGSGKTADSMWEILFDWYKGNEIWTNTPLHEAFDTNFVSKEKGNLHIVDAIDLIKLLLDDNTDLSSRPKTLLLDEIKTQANARNFGSWVNKNLTNFVSQARKRRFRIIYTDQILGAYDRWIRLMTDKIVYCVAETNDDDLGLGDIEYPEPTYFHYYKIDIKNEIDMVEQIPIESIISRATMRNIYPLFKTEKLVTPIELTERYQEMTQ